jgi:SAM-dependent methyltransferase
MCVPYLWSPYDMHPDEKDPSASPESIARGLGGRRTSHDHLEIVCPSCHGPVVWSDVAARCEAEVTEYPIVDGIPIFVLPDARDRVSAFLNGYLTVRHAERWTDDDVDFLLALPFDDKTGRRRSMWWVRAQGFKALRHALQKRYGAKKLRVCELGAGVGWLSYRLARDGDVVVATDVNTDRRDGLGAARHYQVRGTPLPRLACEMDRVPLADGSIDVVVCSASFHYASDQSAVAREAARMLVPRGTFAILDSPVYTERASGEAMVEEFRKRVTREFGVKPEAVASSGFVVRDELLALLHEAGFSVSTEEHWMGWRWTANYARAKLVGRREPARLPLVLARKRK